MPVLYGGQLACLEAFRFNKITPDMYQISCSCYQNLNILQFIYYSTVSTNNRDMSSGTKFTQVSVKSKETSNFRDYQLMWQRRLQSVEQHGRQTPTASPIASRSAKHSAPLYTMLLEAARNV